MHTGAMGRHVTVDSKAHDGRKLWVRLTPRQLRFLAGLRGTRARTRDGKLIREPVGDVLRRLIDAAAAAQAEPP